ncbi:MAG: hypothetical protein QXQ81_00625, partial [Candidatus Thorarchaeota archaeon]
ISKRLSSDAQVIWGARIDPRLTGTIRVMLILTGVRSPQLLPRVKEDTVVSTIGQKRLAELGLLSGPIGQVETRRSVDVRPVGKFPVSTGGSWEDRLKPVDRLVPSRSTARSKAEKYSLDELGLKRLL